MADTRYQKVMINDMNYHIDIQHVSSRTTPVSDEELTCWAIIALKTHYQSAELTLRLVDVHEITQLNEQYRKKNKKTNVLAFPAAHPEHVLLEYPFLGDVILCPQVLEEESVASTRLLSHHWAHIVIHGVLLLMGYDHIKTEDEVKMQALEIELLKTLGIPNPYEADSIE